MAVDDHVSQGLVGAVTLAFAVFKEVDQPDSPVPARFVERDDPGLEQLNQRGTRDLQQIGRFLG